MRALKALAVVIFVSGVVFAVVMIAAWPLGATPASSPGRAAPPPGMSAPPGDHRPVGGVDSSGAASRAQPPPAAGQVPPVPRRSGRAPVGPHRAARPTAQHQVSSSPPGGMTAAVADAAGRGIRQSVIALDRSTGAVLAQSDADLALPSMSLVKLLIAVDLLDSAGGPQNLDPVTSDTLWRMITVSDDAAASRLWVDGNDGAIVTRVAARFHLTGVRPPANPGMWGDTTVTARDVALFLRQALADPAAGAWLAHAMRSAADAGADGFDQDFGMNTVAGAGSKQGWGCCLRGVRSLDSAGFTADRIVVVLSAAAPVTDDASMRSALTATVAAALRA